MRKCSNAIYSIIYLYRTDLQWHLLSNVKFSHFYLMFLDFKFYFLVFFMSICHNYLLTNKHFIIFWYISQNHLGYLINVFIYVNWIITLPIPSPRKKKGKEKNEAKKEKKINPCSLWGKFNLIYILEKCSCLLS